MIIFIYMYTVFCRQEKLIQNLQNFMFHSNHVWILYGLGRDFDKFYLHTSRKLCPYTDWPLKTGFRDFPLLSVPRASKGISSFAGVDPILGRAEALLKNWSLELWREPTVLNVDVCLYELSSGRISSGATTLQRIDSNLVNLLYSYWGPTLVV